MSSTVDFRRPATFRPDDPNVVVHPVPLDMPSHAPLTPLAAGTAASHSIEERRLSTPRRWRMPWSTLFWSATGSLVMLGLGLSVANLISDLFARADSLGYLGLCLAAVAGLAALAIIVRETLGIARLKAIDALRTQAAETLVSDDRDGGRRIIRELLALTRRTPGLARARARLEYHLNEIIDGRDLVRIAERELLADLDGAARRLVSDAAKRVSVVTAVSPRAAVDMLFVLVTALGLVRRLALLYGGRPGTLGLVRLMRHVIAHLAMTGGVAVTDGLVQQMIGHGLAAKLSARLGEGVMNGVLTARLGLAAIEVTRPLPFSALRQPTLQDLAAGLMRSVERNEEAFSAGRARTAD